MSSADATASKQSSENSGGGGDDEVAVSSVSAGGDNVKSSAEAAATTSGGKQDQNEAAAAMDPSAAADSSSSTTAGGGGEYHNLLEATITCALYYIIRSPPISFALLTHIYSYRPHEHQQFYHCQPPLSSSSLSSEAISAATASLHPVANASAHLRCW